MKTVPDPQNRHETRRKAALRQIAQVGPFIEGTLSKVKRRGCKKPGWHLTHKAKGKTQTLYVPMDLADEVTAWTREYKRLKQLIRKVTRHSRALIRRHAASRRAASREVA
jgi:hypothetical protein